MAASAPTAPAVFANLVMPSVTLARITQPTRVPATAHDATGTTVTGPTLGWASADPAIVTVDATGLLTPVYVRQFATLLHTRLDPSLKPHIEYSNEVWNTGFSQTTWANARSQALGLDSPFGQPATFYATRAVQMLKIMQGV